MNRVPTVRLGALILPAALLALGLGACGSSSKKATGSSATGTTQSIKGGKVGSIGGTTGSQAGLALLNSSTPAPFTASFRDNQLVLGFASLAPPGGPVQQAVLGHIIKIVCSPPGGAVTAYAIWPKDYTSVLTDLPSNPPYGKCQLSVNGQPLGYIT